MAGRVIVYAQLGGFGSRLAPLLHQPGLNSGKILSPSGRNLKPWNHNAYGAVPKPILSYFGVALSAPLIRRAAMLGLDDIRATIHNQPEIVTDYYHGKQMGNGICVSKFLYEHRPLDTAGGIVRDVVAGINNETIKKDDTILILGGDIRTDVDLGAFLKAHAEEDADVSMVLTNVKRENMWQYGAAVRKGDQYNCIGSIKMLVPKKERPAEEEMRTLAVFGDLEPNKDPMAPILEFFEKAPTINPAKVDEPGRKMAEDIIKKYGIGAFSPTTLQNGSVYAMKAELIYKLAPLVFNLDNKTASSAEWENCYNINSSGPSKFSDFGGDWFPVFTGKKPWPAVNERSPIADLQRKRTAELFDRVKIWGFLHKGQWSDDGTFRAVLGGHKEILDNWWENEGDLDKAAWPINKEQLRQGFPSGVFTMSNFNINKVEVEPPVFIGPGVIIHDGARLGKYAVINRDWDISGVVEESVLFWKKRMDREIEGPRYVVPADMVIKQALVGSGFDPSQAIDHEGKPFDIRLIEGKVVVSNGYCNVVSPLDI